MTCSQVSLSLVKEGRRLRQTFAFAFHTLCISRSYILHITSHPDTGLQCGQALETICHLACSHYQSCVESWSFGLQDDLNLLLIREIVLGWGKFWPSERRTHLRKNSGEATWSGFTVDLWFLPADWTKLNLHPFFASWFIWEAAVMHLFVQFCHNYLFSVHRNDAQKMVICLCSGFGEVCSSSCLKPLVYTHTAGITSQAHTWPFIFSHTHYAH